MSTDTKVLCNKPNVIGWTNPFQESSTVFGEVPIGTSIKKAISVSCEHANVRKRHRKYSVCQVGKRIDNKIQWSYVPTDKWSSTFLASGDLLRFRLLPKGGGKGKNPLRTILMIVVATVAMVASAGMASYLVGGGLGTAFATTATATAAASLTGLGTALVGLTGLAVMTMGNLLINAIAPIKPPSFSTNSGTQSPTYSISAGRNPINQWGRVPYPLGTGRYAPPKAALPYTENYGDDMYLYELLCLGLGDLEIYDIRIGTTPITEYNSVQYEHRVYDPNNPNLQTVSTLYPNGVYQEDVGVELIANVPYLRNERPVRTFFINLDDVYSCEAYFSYPWGGTNPYEGIVVTFTITNVGSGAFRTVTQRVFFESRVAIPRVGKGQLKISVVADSVTEHPLTWAYLYCNHGDNVTPPTAVPVMQTVYWFYRTEYTYRPQIITKYTSRGSRIVLDFSFEGLVAYDDNGNKNTRKVDFNAYFTNMRTGRLEYRDISFSGKETSITKRSYTYTPVGDVRPTDVYKIELFRNTENSTDDKVRDRSYWASFRTYTYEKPAQPPYKCNFLSIKIKATGQLQGSLDNVTVRYRTRILDYNVGTNTWVHRYTSNPASIYREVLQSYAMARPRKTSQIDLNSLQQAHNFYRSRNFNWNLVCDNSVGVFERLRSICAAGLSSPTAIDGRWAIIVDKPRDNVVMAFTAANSWDWSVKRYTSRLPNAIHSTFVNEDVWDNDMRIVNTDEPLMGEYIHENITYEGVTNAHQVYQLSRFHYAQAKLKRREISLTCFDESLIPTRGDLVDCSIPFVVLTGLQTGRVVKVYRNESDAVIGVKTDQSQTMDLLGRRFGVKIYTESGSIFHAEIKKVDDTVFDLYFTQPTAANIKKGDKYAFGDYGEETFPAIVVDMKFNPDMTATILLQDYTPQLYGNLDLPIPDFVSTITTPIDGKWMLKSKPIFGSIVSDETVLDKSKSPTGVLVKIGVTSPANIDARARVVQLSYRLYNDPTWTYFGQSSINDTYLYLTEVLENTYYDLRIRYADEIGSFGEWSYHYKYKVIGRTNPPPAPIRLVIDGTVISWELPSNAPIDIIGFYIFMVYDVTDPIEWGKKITSPYTKDYKFDLREYTGFAQRVFVQTVDELLNVSSPISIAINLGDAPIGNIVFEMSEKEFGWQGSMINCTVVDDELISTGVASFWGLESFWG